MKQINPSELSPDLIASIVTTFQNQQANPLVEILERRLRKEEAEKDEEIRVQKEARKQNALALDARRKTEELEQEVCPHIKPNRESNVVGQRDHKNNYHYFCQTCKKHWVNNELPSHLAIDMNRVGGPQF